MAIQKFIIDLSGKGGLSNDYYGNKYLASSVQVTFGSEQTRYLAEDGQFVAGVFNPFIRPGYMSPGITSVTAVTTSGSYDAFMACSQYDDINDVVYMFESGTTIHKGDTPVDTTWTEDKTIANAITTIFKNSHTTDTYFLKILPGFFGS